MTSIILDPGVKELLLKDARDFLESKAWYSERGIPYRRGYLLVSPRQVRFHRSPEDRIDS